MTQRKRLALIDGHALAFRAFHALREAGMRASSGEPTYAVFGFAQILLTMIQEQRPEYVAVSFDVGRTFRDDLYAEYKAGRGETPEEFHPQLERIKELMRALSIPIYTLDGYEADDVIGTLACQATAQDVETLILTGDTDSLQLVDGHVRVLLANPYAKGGKNTTLYDEAAVRERYDGLAPAQLADLRGLKGDTSDNIPGVKGIGEKGAIALLNQFGTVESLFDRLDEAPNRYKKVLDGQREAALFSKRLATIVCDAPVQLDLAACAVGEYDRAAVIRLFQELEIGARSGLLKKLPPMSGEPVEPEGEPAPPQPAIAAKGVTQHDLFAEALPDTLAAAPEAAGTVQLNLFGEPATPVARARPAPAESGAYAAVTSEAALDELVAALRAAPGFAFDTEASGLRPLDCDLVGISVSHTPGSAAYIPVGHAAGEQLPRERVLDALRPLFEDEALPKYAHNAKFDIEMLEAAGVRVRGLTFDTMVAAALLNKKVGLKDLAFYELRDHPSFALTEPPTPIEELIGRGQKQITFDQVPIDRATPYAAADADLTLRLKEVLEPQLRAHPRVYDIFTRLEMPLVEVLTAMEQAGITLDKGYIEGLGARLGERIGELAEQIYAAAGQQFNINSGAQLNAILFDSGKFGLDPKALGLSRLKTGGYSITADVLEQMAPLAPIAELILRYRQLTKLKSTYVDALPALVSPKTGRVHTSYNQVGSATGRLSCLPAGTLVNTQHGLVGIEEVRPGDTVRTAFGPREITAWAATGMKPVIVLKLSNGITLRCSPEHQLRSMGRWVEARDLKVGAPLYMSYTSGMFGNETKLNIDYTSHYDTCKTPSLPTDWSVELAELVGYHMADGHIARSNYNNKPANLVLAFGWDDEELIEYFTQHICALFGKAPKRRNTRSCPVLTVVGVDIAGAFMQLGAGGKSAEIRVPSSLYRAPEEIVAGFLRGYFEGDGSVSADTISVRSVSLPMLQDVQQLLTLFGITSRITQGSPDPRGYAQRYTLRLAGRRSNAIFFRRISFLSNKKHLLSWGAAQQHEAPHTVKNSAELLTLSPGFAISDLKPFIHAVSRGEDGRVSMAAHSLISKVATGRTNTLTTARAEWIVAALPPDHASASAAFLREAVAGQYFEVAISAIEHETPVPMYDIAVADVQQYIANGITLHNSVDPNLQNIPVRTLEGREIRRGFVAAPGCCFVAADYSQIELRVLAHYTRDPALIATFQEGRDIHATTASRLFGVEQDKVDKNQRRIAKCVAAGTLVTTERGLIPIEELATAAPGEVSDLGLVVAQEGRARGVATGFYNGGVQQTIRITTERGYVLEATGQHQVRSIDSSGTYVWRRLAELAEGEYVALGRGAMLFGQDEDLAVTYTRRRDKKLTLPTRLTPAFARFLGYYVAEGNMIHGRTSSSLVISNTDSEVLDDLRQISRQLFGDVPQAVMQKTGVTMMRWNCSRLVELVEQLGVGKGAANKRIPAIIMRASYDSQMEFLRAFFEGDGSISGSFISAASKSEGLIRQLQTLLLNLGIATRLEHRDVPNYGRHFKLRVLGREGRALFAEHIGFISSRKRERLTALLTRQVTHEAVVLPNQVARLTRMYPKTKRDNKELIHTCIRTKSRGVELTYRRLSAILEGFPEPEDDDALELRAHLERNVFYDRVVKIEPGECQVYDLVVPENNTYIANGFVSHNTVTFGIIYGISSFGLSSRLGMSRGEAQGLIDGVFASFPGIKAYIDETLAFAREHGYVTTLFGRRRAFPELASGDRGPRAQAAMREAINAPIQGTAADIMKIAMINVHRALAERGMATKMLLQVHDELILEAPDHEIEAAARLAREVMEGAYPALAVPLGVEVETGTNWEEMRPEG